MASTQVRSGIEQLVSGMNDIVASHLARWHVGSVVDLYGAISPITFEIAAKLLIGIESRDDIACLSSLFRELVSRPAKVAEAATATRNPQPRGRHQRPTTMVFMVASQFSITVATPVEIASDF